MSNSVFQEVNANHPRKHSFDLSHTVDFDAKIGAIYPILLEELVPGDVVNIGNNVKVNFQPTKAPISDYLEVKVDYFFGPNRIVWNKENGDLNSWEEFITQVPTGEDGQTVPEFTVPPLKWSPQDTSLHSTWDYFGFPVGKAPKGNARPSLIPLRLRNKIWNDFYRDENLQEEISLDSEETLWANASKDYLTSAFKTRQRGSRIGLPVNSQISPRYLPFTYSIVDSSSGVNKSTFKRTYVNMLASDKETPAYHGVHFDTQGHTIGGDIVDAKIGSNNENVTFIGTGSGSDGFDPQTYLSVRLDTNDLSITSSTFDITDLRLAFQIQKWQERSLRGGDRYTEFLHSFFGVSPRDDRLQRPEYIGGSRSPVISSTIISKGVGSDGDETIPLGSYAGYLISADGEHIGKYRCLEFGWLIGLLRIVPKVKYTDGINRMFLRNTPFDYYFPEFANLSEQGIYNEEVFVTDNDEETNLSIWGYQGIYNELRHRNSRVCGALRSENDFLFWTMARKFASLPNLNGNFISFKYMQTDIMRIFAVTDPDVTYPCIVHVKNYISNARPMPYIPIPR